MIGFKLLNTEVERTPVIPKSSEYQFVKRDGVEICLQGKLTKVYRPQIDIKEYDERQEDLIALLYKEKGDQFSEELNGHFIIFIKDGDSLKIFNNRYLATKLYYYYNESIFIYGTTFREVLEFLPSEKKVNLGAIKTFLSNGWNSPDETLIKGIFKILPTYRIIIDHKVRIENHWDKEFTFERRPFQNLENKIQEYESIYKEGIENHLYQAKTKELGTLLSGGHDTSFALLMGSRIHSKPMHAFTATFPGWAFDESAFAKNIANKVKATHHEVPFCPEDLDYLPNLIIANEEPVVGSSLPVHLCALEASKYVDTMLAGDGGDTMWGEYFPVAEVHRYIKNLPLSIRKLIYKTSHKLREVFDWERFWELEHVTELFAHEDMYEHFLRRLCTYRHFSDEYLEKILNKEYFGDVDFACSSLELKFYKENFSEMLIEGKLFNGFYTYQSYHTHRSMNFFGLDLYLPTINKEFLQFITELPLEWVNGGTTFHKLTNSLSVNRRFHKKVLSQYLKKEEIYNRSFDIPWYNILRPRKELLLKLKERLLKRGWFDEATIETIFKEFMEQEVKDYELLELKNHGYRIFTLLSLEVWCIEFLDGRESSKSEEKKTLEEYLS